jgi:primary-amine oxidase
MVNDSRLRKSIAYFEILAASALVLVLSPLASAQQAPPAEAAVSSRPQSLSRSAATATPDISASRHPLDPLESAEVELAVATIRKERQPGDSVRFVSVSLKEPSKEVVGRYRSQAGGECPREAFVILLDKATGRGYEADVDLRAGAIRRYEALPEGVQPPIMLEEFAECEEAVRKSPAFRDAMKKRGIEDLSLVKVDAWSAGHYGNEPPEDRGKRLVRALCWLSSEPRDNYYARPIENIVAVVDLNRRELLRVEDYGVVPLPPQSGNWSREYIKETQNGLKPLAIVEPEGPSFAVQGREVKWQKWSFRVGFNPREGLVLHSVGYDGRPVLSRASIVEMMVPYADPKASSYHKNVFDLGEYGIGMMANSLAIGCDCLGTIRYFDAHLADNRGRPVTIKNAICLHEEDFGMLWKHTDWRSGQSEVRRSRRLAVSTVATVGNYNYGFYWYFYQDGTIQVEVKLTGIMNTTALAPGQPARHGTEVAPGLNAPYHQHYFNARLDFAIDGENNTVEEVNTVSMPTGPENPFNSGYTTETTPMLKESQTGRNTNPASARFWRVVNPGRKNAMGRPVAYRLCPGETTLPFAQPGASLVKRAAFLTRNLWVTPFDPKERFPAGEYPNQNPGGDGLPRWMKADRDLADRDLVVWYTFGGTHIPRLEDWPVMPVVSVGFMLRPDGFFDRNPALDLPAPSSP